MGLILPVFRHTCARDPSHQEPREPGILTCARQNCALKKLQTTTPVGYKIKTARVKAGPQMFPAHFDGEGNPDATVACRDPKRVPRHTQELAKRSLVTHLQSEVW